MALHCQTRNRENKDKETKSLKKKVWKVFFSNERKDGLHNQKDIRQKKYDVRYNEKQRCHFLYYFFIER